MCLDSIDDPGFEISVRTHTKSKLVVKKRLESFY